MGAGKIGALSASRLATTAGEVQVWNRSVDKADRLADRVDGAVVDDLAAGLVDADVVVCTTGAPEPVVTAELVQRGGDRAQRPLVLLDLAMPHNVDPACADLPGVTVVGIADVRDLAQRSATGDALDQARRIVADEAARFSAWMSAIEVEPTIRALRARAESVRTGELARLQRRLATLDDEQREAARGADARAGQHLPPRADHPAQGAGRRRRRRRGRRGPPRAVRPGRRLIRPSGPARRRPTLVEIR